VQREDRLREEYVQRDVEREECVQAEGSYLEKNGSYVVSEQTEDRAEVSLPRDQ